MHRIAGLAIMLVVALVLLSACTGNNLAGKYVSERSSDYRELDADGTFFAKQGDIGLSGTYRIKGDEITYSLAFSSVAFKGRIEGNTLVDEDGERFTKSGKSPNAAKSQGRSGAFEELLKFVPDTPETRSGVHISDYRHVREVLHLVRPGPDASEDDLIRYVFGVRSGDPDGKLPVAFDLTEPPFISGMDNNFNLHVEHLRNYLGFGPQDVDQSIVTGLLSARLEIVTGSFDSDVTEKALSLCAQCPPYIRESHHGVSFFRWGEDGQMYLDKRFGPPAYDRFGWGGRIAVADGYVLRTVATPAMKVLIETILKKRPSLRDVDEYRLLAQGLDHLDAFAGWFTNETQALDTMSKEMATRGPQELKRWERVLQQDLLLKPYQAVALGVGKNEKGFYATVVLVHSEERFATDNVGLLRRRINETSIVRSGQPWTERISKAEINKNGKVVEAKLYGAITRSWESWYETEPLLLHESVADTAEIEPPKIKVKRMQAGSGCTATDPGPVQSLDIEKEYLPVVVASENGASGIPLEALKAQAVASRTFAFYKMQSEPRSPTFDLCDTEADQVYNPSVTVSPQVRKAVEETRGIVAKWKGEVIAAFFVKGDARMAGYVTVNEGKRGADVKPTTLGSPANSHNRGAMSQDKANELAAQGWDHQRILRYFYGTDLELSR